MSDSILFQNVSKRYRLGMTRKSIPSVVSSWAKSIGKRGQAESAGSQDFWAVRDVSFNLQRGDALALVGANGAGKTTILKLIAKITKPTSGSISVFGQLSALIELGAGFHPDLSGRENIFLNGAILGLKKADIQRRFDSIVSFAELSKFIDTPVKRYSSGMTVRLGFAVAASIDPDILLVDEVLAVGDTNFRIKCVNRIQELQRNGTTLIFVSHNMGLVKAVCDKAVYIERGQMKLFGETNEVIEAYNHDLNQARIAQNSAEETGKSPVAVATTASITEVEIVGLQTGKDKVIVSNRPAQIVVHYHANEDLGEAALILRIVRSDGVSCCKLQSEVGLPSLKIDGGFGKVVVTLDPVQLFPGTYQVNVALKNKAMTMNYDVAYSDWFSVEGNGAGHIDLDAVYEPNQVWDHETETVSNGLLKGI